MDGGGWQQAEISHPPTTDAWVQWVASAQLDPGDHQVKVRCTDRNGLVQTGVDRDVLPDGATGWHTVGFDRLTARVNDFAGRTGAALVVGGSGGLGVAIVRMLARRGSDVALTYCTRKDGGESVAASAREWGVRATAYELDLTFPEAAADAVAAAAEDFGGLHTVVYAAGPHVPLSHLAAVAPATMTAQLAADAAGFFAVVQPALPAPAARPGRDRGGHHRGDRPLPARDGLSSAPKAAVEALVRALAAEEGRFGVRVNAVGPGMLTDGMAGRLISSGELSPTDLDRNRANVPLRRFGTATDVAEAVCFLASRPGRVHLRPEARRRRRLRRLTER